MVPSNVKILLLLECLLTFAKKNYLLFYRWLTQVVNEKDSQVLRKHHKLLLAYCLTFYNAVKFARVRRNFWGITFLGIPSYVA